MRRGSRRMGEGLKEQGERGEGERCPRDGRADTQTHSLSRWGWDKKKRKKKKKSLASSYWNGHGIHMHDCCCPPAYLPSYKDCKSYTSQILQKKKKKGAFCFFFFFNKVTRWPIRVLSGANRESIISGKKRRRRREKRRKKGRHGHNPFVLFPPPPSPPFLRIILHHLSRLSPVALCANFDLELVL